MGKSTIIQELREQTRNDFIKYIYALHYESYGVMSQRDIETAFINYLQSLAMQAAFERR